MATEEQSAGFDNSSEENPKPSFLKKVKAKAKKLKSKIKHNSNEDSHSTSAGAADEDGSPDHHGYESSIDASSGDEAVHEVDGVPYTPLNNLVHNHQPGGTVTARSPEGDSNGTTPGNEYPSTTNPAAYKNRAPADLQQAVPTTYHYFNDDPETARLPSDYGNSSLKRGTSPAGGDIVPSSQPVEKLAKEEIPESHPKSNGVEFSKLDKEAAIKSPETLDVGTGGQSVKTRSDDRLLSGGVEQDKGVGLPVASSFGILTPSKSAENRSVETPDPQAAQQGVSRPLSATQDGEDVSKPTASPRKALTPANSLQGSELPAADHSDTSFLEQVKEAVTNSSTISDQDGNSPEDVTAAAESGAVESASGKPIHHRAYEGLAAAAVGATGLAAAGGEKLGLFKSESSTPVKGKLTQASSTLPTAETIEKDNDAHRESGAGKSSYSHLNEALAGTDSSSAKEENAGTPAEDTTWSQKAYNAVFGAKANVAEKISPENSNGSTTSRGEVHRSGENGHSDVGRDESFNSSVTSQKPDENLKTSDSADKALSSDGKSMSQKASEAASRTAGFATQTTTPDHHDKALASSITESISSLPGLLTSKLGFGGNSSSATASPTGSRSGASEFKEPHVSDVKASPTHPSADTHAGSETTVLDETPTAPGILDRMSGVASSLFGGAKKPVSLVATDESSS